MLLRILVVLCWILVALAPASAQTSRRKSQRPSPAKAPTTGVRQIPPDNPGPAKPDQLRSLERSREDDKGLVRVPYTIDLAKLLGGEESMMTLDGGPVPVMKKTRTTLGVVIDNEGHVVTRLVDVTPTNPPLSVSVRPSIGPPATAKFLGMDTVTGLCVLEVKGVSLEPPNFYNSTLLPKQLNIQLRGFHPKLNQNTPLQLQSPRLHSFQGQIIKAVGDFRYNASNPIYYLIDPQMTAVQDCSLVFNKDSSVFGMAIYNIGGEGKPLVYPISRIQSIAQSVIKNEKSIAYGWIGITGRDVSQNIPTPLSRTSPPTELGVRILTVAPDSPAELAGVKPHDVVVAINDRKVDTQAQMVTLMKQISPDCEVGLKIKRNREYKTLKIKLVPAPALEPEQQITYFAHKLQGIEEELKVLPSTHPNRPVLEDRQIQWRIWVDNIRTAAPPDIRLRVFYGFEIQTLTGQLMNYFAVNNGVLVSNVTENGKASRSGLQTGDIILEVGGTSVTNLATLMKALDAAGSAPIEITVSRRRERQKITFQH